MNEHIPRVTSVEISPAGVLRNKYRVRAYGGNNKVLVWSQAYKEKRQAEGMRLTMLCMLKLPETHGTG
jgi:hypothetical protein